MQENLDTVTEQAKHGDLRPQFNPRAVIVNRDSKADPKRIEPILLDRFFRLSRPIADASRASAADMRLQDSGQFFYLIESLKRLGCSNVDETLLVILDEFLSLEPSSYNELYLLSIVQLSRTDIRYVESFWPAVLELDLRWRSAPWKRPTGAHLVDQPYRMTELLFYYFVISTLHYDPPGWASRDPLQTSTREKFPSLGFRLMHIMPRMTREQKTLAAEVLLQLSEEDGRVSYGDARGLLSR